MKYARKTNTKRPYKKKVRKVYPKKYNKNNTKLVKEVYALSKRLEGEKKNAVIAITSTNFAQNNTAGASGVNCQFIIPTISQGLTVNDRIGDCIKMVSFCLQIEVITQTPTIYNDIHYKFYLVQQMRNPIFTTTTLIDQFLLPNIFTSVVDYNSDRNYEHFKDYKILGYINGRMDSSKNDAGGQSIPRRQHKIARKTNVIMRYSKGTTTMIEGPIALIAVADYGDIATSTGLTFQASLRMYYIDN